MIRFSVPGTPLPRGSVVGRVVRGRCVLTDRADMKTKSRASGALRRWQERIAEYASDPSRVAVGSPVDGAVRVTLEFALKRPRSHLTASRSRPRKEPPPYPGKPDIDKLARAVLDAMSGVVYVDDAQVVELVARKRWAEIGAFGGVYITVEEATCDESM